jgi:hypothetical protein
MSKFSAPICVETKNNAVKFLCVIFIALSLLSAYIPEIAPRFTGSLYIINHFALTLIMLTIWYLKPDRQNIVLASAIIAQALLLFAEPFTTHDVARYLWDGAVLLNGFDPYIITPNDTEVEHLRALWPTPEEHAKYPTIYPPFAITLLASAASFGPMAAPVAWKIMTTAVAIATIIQGKKLLTLYGKEQHFSLIALSPLLLMESGIGAHLDIFCVLFIVLALIHYKQRNFITVGILFGLCFTVKFLPAVILFPLAIKTGFPKVTRNTVALCGSFLVTATVIYGIALLADLQVIGVLATFLQKWRFGSPIFSYLSMNVSGAELLFILGGIALSLLCIVVLKVQQSTILSCQIMYATPLLISPVVFPWYLLAFIPFIALRPSITLLLWCSALPLTYEVLDQYNATGIWAFAVWPVTVTGVVLLIGITLDITLGITPDSTLKHLKRLIT